MSKMNFMKKKLILMIAAMFVLVFSGYVVSAEEIPKLEISVTAKITNAKKTIRVDKKVLLVVKDGKKIIPAEKVTFKSSNKKIVNISTTGYLKRLIKPSTANNNIALLI